MICAAEFTSFFDSDGIKRIFDYYYLPFITAIVLVWGEISWSGSVKTKVLAQRLTPECRLSSLLAMSFATSAGLFNRFNAYRSAVREPTPDS